MLPSTDEDAARLHERHFQPVEERDRLRNVAGKPLSLLVPTALISAPPDKRPTANQQQRRKDSRRLPRRQHGAAGLSILDIALSSTSSFGGDIHPRLTPLELGCCPDELYTAEGNEDTNTSSERRTPEMTSLTGKVLRLS